MFILGFIVGFFVALGICFAIAYWWAGGGGWMG